MSSCCLLHCSYVNLEPSLLLRSCVRVVSSTRSGMGKSLYIERQAQKLTQLNSGKDIHVTIPIHGPTVTSDTLLNFFEQHIKKEACTLYHLDIAPRVCTYL